MLITTSFHCIIVSYLFFLFFLWITDLPVIKEVIAFTDLLSGKKKVFFLVSVCGSLSVQFYQGLRLVFYFETPEYRMC